MRHKETKLKDWLYPRKYWGRIALHIPIGIVISLLILIHPTLSVMFGAGFYIYEISENFDEHDKAYPDIAGSLWGIVIGAVGVHFLSR